MVHLDNKKKTLQNRIKVRLTFEYRLCAYHYYFLTEAASSQGDDLDTIILVWMWPFGHQFDLGLCSSMYDIHGCHLTVDKSQFNKAHGVLIHHRDIQIHSFSLLIKLSSYQTCLEGKAQECQTEQNGTHYVVSHSLVLCLITGKS